MSFIRKIWYVAAWSTEVGQDSLVGRSIIGEPVVLWRTSDGQVHALEDRCPHRRAPLSLGRVEGGELRCMYHGLRFDGRGQCQHIPGTDERPHNLDARAFPVVERDGWVWLWPGDPAAADPALIPSAWGTDNERYVMRTGAIDYEADYQLINDNLTDLSHLDFVHETTLGRSTGSLWSATLPKIQTLQNGIRISRWFPPAPVPFDDQTLFETWNSYTYLLPGIFLMKLSGFPVGTADRFGQAAPTEAPVWDQVGQQAVTPISSGRSRYLFASGVPRIMQELGLSEGLFEVVEAAFEEDRQMIEAQQRVWDQTPPDRPMAFIPQDKGPAIIRRMIAARLRQELGQSTEIVA